MQLFNPCVILENLVHLSELAKTENIFVSQKLEPVRICDKTTKQHSFSSELHIIMSDNREIIVALSRNSLESNE